MTDDSRRVRHAFVRAGIRILLQREVCIDADDRARQAETVAVADSAFWFPVFLSVTTHAAIFGQVEIR